MKIIVKIGGREAVPVRALPLLTDWQSMHPQAVAMILAGKVENWPSFEGLSAYRLQADGEVEQIPSRWWASWMVGALQAKSDTIKTQQVSQAAGTEQWKQESLALLPAGVFVWRDEFEAAHLLEYGALSMRARSAPQIFNASTYALDFNPEPPPDIAPQHLVLEGFVTEDAPRQTQQSIHATTEAPAPVSDKTVLPVQRSTAQDTAILNAIRDARCDPLKLPKPPQGKAGIKATVRAALVGKNPVFPQKGTQFEKAWERLRNRREIADLG